MVRYQIGNSKCWLLFQRTGSTAKLTWWFTAVCNVSSWSPYILTTQHSLYSLRMATREKKPMHMSTDTVLLLLLGIVGFMYMNPIKAQRVFGAFVLFWFVVSEYIQCRVDSIHRCEAGRGCDSFQLLYTKILQHNQKLFAICPCYDPILHIFLFMWHGWVFCLHIYLCTNHVHSWCS